MAPFDPGEAFDPGMNLGALYQQDAQNKISQGKVAERKAYTGGYAGKYGVNDVSAKVKGLSDTDLYDMAANLVSTRRKASAPPAGTTPPPGAAKPPAPKITPKVTPKTAPKVTPKVAPKTAPRTTTARRPPSRKRKPVVRKPPAPQTTYRSGLKVAL